MRVAGGQRAFNVRPQLRRTFQAFERGAEPLRTAAGLATTANWASNLLVSLTFLTLTDLFGPSQTFWLYGVLTVVALVFAYKLVPETKGRTLEEIAAFWQDGHGLPSGARPVAADTPDRAA
jgi:hypothetical protein